MTQPTRVVVSVDADDPHLLNDIAERLSEAGLDVDNVLAEIATIVGTCDAGTVGDLRSVPGVLDVESQRVHQLPPPGSETQ